MERDGGKEIGGEVWEREGGRRSLKRDILQTFSSEVVFQYPLPLYTFPENMTEGEPVINLECSHDAKRNFLGGSTTKRGAPAEQRFESKSET